MFQKILQILEYIFLLPENPKKYIELYRDKTSYYKKEINNFSLDKVFISLLYEENLQKDLKNFKYRYNVQSKNEFIKFYRKLFEEKLIWINKDNIIITWIPMFFINKFLRWYNQTYILAQDLSKEIEIPFFELIRKVKYTKEQAWLSKEKRLNNLKNSFKINPKYRNKIKWKTIIIIDDVISTWTTVNEVSKVLKQNWVKNVIWLFLATWS